MEFSYTDIEARIREAQKLRSAAMGEILAAAYTKIEQGCKALIQHKAAHTDKSSPAHSY